MKTNLVYLFSIFSILFLVSCSEDDDTLPDNEAPEINMVDPGEHEEITPGGEIHFDALFTDNEELASFKIEVHNAFDGHSHATAELKQEEQDNPWSYEEVFEIEPGQTSYEAHEHIEVPAELNGEPISAGHYHFGVFVTDVAGNQSQAFVEIHIEGEHDHEEGDHDEDDHDHDH